MQASNKANCHRAPEASPSIAVATFIPIAPLLASMMSVKGSSRFGLDLDYAGLMLGATLTL